MLGSLRLAPRLALVFVVALLFPHPISYREGGYLPVAVLATLFPDEPGGALLMLGFCLLLYAVPLLLLSFVFLRHPPRPGEADAQKG